MVTVDVVNREPIAYAGRDQAANVNSEVTLMGSVSDLDPAGRDSVTHEWTQEGGPRTVTLSVPTDNPPHRKFTPTVSGEYVFRLTST